MTDMEATQAPDQPEAAASEPTPEPTNRTSRHAKIMRRIVAPALGLLAVASFALGALNYTVWRPDPKVTASAPSVTQRYIVTDPGVANLGDQKVEVTVQSSSQSVCVALGEGRDVSGWVAGHPYTRLTGLSDWHNLTVEDAAAAGATSSTPSGASGSSSTGNAQDESADVAFDKSDMWIDVKCGSGKLDTTWNVDNGSQVLLIDTQAKTSAGTSAGTGTPDTTVSLTWVRSKVLDLGTPFTAGGVLLAIAAAAAATVFAMPPHRRRKKQKAVAAPAPAVDEHGTPLWARGAKPANADVELTLTGMAPIGSAPASAQGDGPSIVDVHDVNMLERNGAKSAEQAEAEAHDALVPSPFVGAPDEPPYGSSAADFPAMSDEKNADEAQPQTGKSAQAASDAADESDDTGEFDVTAKASRDEQEARAGQAASGKEPAGPAEEQPAASAEEHSESSVPEIPEVLIPEEPEPAEQPETKEAEAAPEADDGDKQPEQEETDAQDAQQAQSEPEHEQRQEPEQAKTPEEGLASLVSSMPDPAENNLGLGELAAAEITAHGEAVAESPEFDDYFSRLVHETQEIPPIDDQGKPKRQPRSRREMREARERSRKKKGGKQ